MAAAEQQQEVSAMTAACRLDFELSVLPHHLSSLSAEGLVTLLHALQLPDSDLSRLYL